MFIIDKIFNLKIDTKNKSITTVTGLKQFDNNSILNITLLQNSLALDLSNCTVRLNFIREDKRVLLYMTDIVSAREGKVSIKLSPEVLEKPGNIQADISVFDSNLLKITSATFNLKVDKSIYSNDYYFNMKDFDIVQRMHIEEEARIKNEKTRIEAESNRITDEKKRSDAEALRNEKETERISNEEKRVQAENKRNEDEHIRIEAENKRKEYESNRIDQEKIRVENEKARSKSEDQRKIADNTMAENELARITYEQQRQANEKARTEKETKRITNEKLRTEAEEKRVEDEKLRVEKEIERANSENTRVTAEQKRETNETNRVEAEKTRVEEWDKIKNTFKDNAPGDMKAVVYDKNNNGKVDIAEVAESIDWDNVKNKPDFSEIGKVKSVNSKTGEVVLKAADIKGEDGTNLEELISKTKVVPLEDNVIYVNALKGNDKTGDGSFDNPFASLTSAVVESNRRNLLTNLTPIVIKLQSNLNDAQFINNFHGCLNLNNHEINGTLTMRNCTGNIINGVIEGFRIRHCNLIIQQVTMKDLSDIEVSHCNITECLFNPEQKQNITAINSFASLCIIFGCKIYNYTNPIKNVGGLVISDGTKFENCASKVTDVYNAKSYGF
ncbi:BppU family phage baseplate upper protein [Clostridium haemolyticum]|uniref:BppU family phage baseplate upper protein n=2 Tax=Clostridium TaxID=1485 RepID=UPI00069D5111|nr:BppU family phage baseplate upper protein [Clostridium haemolyticum]